MTNAMYKSNEAGHVLESLQLPNVSPEREKQILGGVPYSAGTISQKNIDHLRAVQAELNMVGVRNGLYRRILPLLDKLGITSPTKRREKYVRGLEGVSADIERRIRHTREELTKMTNKAREIGDLICDGGIVMSKYEMLEQGLMAAISRHAEKAAQVSEEIQKLDPKDPQVYQKQQVLADLQKEIDQMEDDADEAHYNVYNAASAINNFNMIKESFEKGKYALKHLIHKLQKAKTKVDITRNRIALYIGDRNGDVADGLQGVQDANAACKSAVDAFGHLPEKYDDLLVDVMTEADAQDLDITAMNDATKTLRQSLQRSETDVVRRAKEILRNKMSA